MKCITEILRKYNQPICDFDSLFSHQQYIVLQVCAFNIYTFIVKSWTPLRGLPLKRKLDLHISFFLSGIPSLPPLHKWALTVFFVTILSGFSSLFHSLFNLLGYEHLNNWKLKKYYKLSRLNETPYSEALWHCSVLEIGSLLLLHGIGCRFILKGEFQVFMSIGNIYCVFLSRITYVTLYAAIQN